MTLQLLLLLQIILLVAIKLVAVFPQVQHVQQAPAAMRLACFQLERGHDELAMHLVKVSLFLEVKVFLKITYCCELRW